MTERLLRGLYSAVLYVLTPVTVYHLIWRGFRFSEYFLRWDERYGSYRMPARPAHVWLHAVSVGEVNAAEPVINALRRSRPDLYWIITTITPTGSERVRALWGQDPQIQHVYAPYDLPGAVGRFLKQFQPTVALVMETELWPNLLFGCRDRQIPAYILNARLSARSLRGYAVLRPLISRTLRTLSRIGAQSSADAKRFMVLGASESQLIDTGNLKFDIAVPAHVEDFVHAFGTQLDASRPVWIAASTHEGEEAAVLAMHASLRRQWPELLLLWAPRHPERFPRVADLAREKGFQVATRRVQQWPQADTDVFVIDTLGELMAFYACAQVAFVGGSLQPIGGHNLLEPAAVGTPAVTGPHLHNFVEISKRLKEAGALAIGSNAEEVTEQLRRLLADPALRLQMQAHGRALVEHGRGALVRTLAMVDADLPAADAVA